MTKSWLGTLLLGTLAALAQAQEPAPTRKPGSVEVGKDGTVTVSGKTTFADSKQDVHEKVRGSVSAMLWYTKEGAQLARDTTVEIVDGTWTATFFRPEHAGERPDRISLRGARIEDNPVILETDDLSLAEGADLTLRLRAIPELRLRVIDAETKEELTEVGVFRCKGEDNKLHPGPGARLEGLVDAGKSPLLVPSPDEVHPKMTTTLWVRAPGYAWGSVEILFAEGGLREVPLVRGGSAKITITGKVPAAEKLALRVYGKTGGGGSPLLDLANARGDRELEDVAPGSYEVRLELGDWFREPRVLARAPMVVVAGQQAAVELVVKNEVAAPDRVTLRGTFVVPSGWKKAEKPLSVTLDPLRGTDRWTERRWLHESELKRGDKDGEYRFTFRDTPVGRYSLVFEPSSHQRVVRVSKDGMEDLRIELPEPVEIVVRVLDRDTKEPRNGFSLAWHPEYPPGVLGSLDSASAALNSNEVRFLVPAGRIVVQCFADAFEVPWTRLDVAPDEHEFEVFAVVRNGVKVALYEGTTRVPLDAWDVSLLTLDGQPALGGESSFGSDLTLFAPKPGTYILRVEAADGYKPIADRQVKLGPPPFPTIDIKVARK